MNYKMLAFSYRARYSNVIGSVSGLKCINGKFNKILNVGCGEGDYDVSLKKFCKKVYSCDINKDDIDYCRSVNKSRDIAYSVQDIASLDYPSGFFDLVICVDVLEHAASQKKALANINRVLKKGGYAIITAPQNNFPLSYDPINRFLGMFGKKLGIGAYSFGHNVLIKEKDIEKLFRKERLKVLKKKYVSKGLAGFFEMYWVGFMQKVLKPNAANKKKSKRS